MDLGESMALFLQGSGSGEAGAGRQLAQAEADWGCRQREDSARGLLETLVPWCPLEAEDGC